MTPSTGPTLLTGVKLGDSDLLVDNLIEWERKFVSKLGEAYAVSPRCSVACSQSPNGSRSLGKWLYRAYLLSKEFRIRGSLPALASMVSRPRQPITAGEELLRRFDAGVRPYWLRDWQSGFGGYIKVYEYQVKGETRRWFSVAHVVRPRTKSTNACLCFTLMSKMPDQKP